MIEAAISHFEVDMPVNGLSQRDTANDIIRRVNERARLGRSRAADEALLAKSLQNIATQEIPEAAAYLWEWFLQMHWRRQNSGFGPQALSSMEILAWSHRYGRHLTPWENYIIDQLDNAWLGVYAQARKLEQAIKKQDAPMPVVETLGQSR